MCVDAGCIGGAGRGGWRWFMFCGAVYDVMLFVPAWAGADRGCGWGVLLRLVMSAGQGVGEVYASIASDNPV